MLPQESSWSSHWGSQAGGGLGRGILTGFTKVSKGFAAFFVVGYVLSLISPTTQDYFALIPAKTIPFGWNLITAGYLETTLSQLILSIVAILYFGKILQPIWGTREFVKFIVVVNFLAAIGTFIIAIILYYATTNEKEYLYTPISGFHGAWAGFLVAFKQIVPDQEFPILFSLKTRAKWAPSLFVAIVVVSSFIFKDPIKFLPFVLFGTYGAWLYLRYSQRKPETNLRGDPSEEFAFATFFPEFLSPAVNVVAVVFERIFCGRSKMADELTNGYAYKEKPLPGSDPIDASRRRERGARALEERLSANAKPVETEAAKEDDGPTGLPVSLSAAEPLGPEDRV